MCLTDSCTYGFTGCHYNLLLQDFGSKVISKMTVILNEMDQQQKKTRGKQTDFLSMMPLAKQPGCRQTGRLMCEAALQPLYVEHRVVHALCQQEAATWVDGSVHYACHSAWVIRFARPFPVGWPISGFWCSTCNRRNAFSNAPRIPQVVVATTCHLLPMLSPINPKSSRTSISWMS